MTDKELYGLMVRYHSIVTEYLKRDDNNQADDIENRTKSISYLRLVDGVKIVSTPIHYLYKWGFCTFDISKPSFIKELLELEIDLYKHDNCTNTQEFVCSTYFIEQVLQQASSNTERSVYWLKELYKAPSNIYNLRTSGYRIGSNYFSYYIDTVQNNIEQTKHPINAYDGWFVERKIGIEKYGVFAYQHLYTDVEWNFDLVEQYKDSIVWKLLIEKSNLQWSEDMIIKYFQYIPFKLSADFYCNQFDNENTLKDYSKIESLNFSFIDKYKNKIDILALFKTGAVNLTGQQLKYLFEYIKSDQTPYSQSHPNTPAGSQIAFWMFRHLANNPNFEWKEDSIIAVSECGELDCLYDNVTEERRKLILDVILSIPNYKELLKDDVFLKKLKDGRGTIAYSDDFTIENVKINITNWNEVVSDQFQRINRRSRDTYYYVNVVKTTWDHYAENKNVVLTYELCKFLINHEITIGGEYQKEYHDQDHYDFGCYSLNVNGLKHFKDHSIKDEQELEKIYSDSLLLELFFSDEYKNDEVIEYTINKFFENYEKSDFLEVIESLQG